METSSEKCLPTFKQPAGFRRQWGLGAVVLFCLVNLPSSASPTQHPKRNINVYTIDLSPLFKWWAKHEGPRPLSSWVHITGSIVDTNSGAWIIEAQVEGAARNRPDPDNSLGSAPTSPLRILLQNPPVEDLVEFEQLSSRLNELIMQRANAAGEENQAKMSEHAISLQQHEGRRNSVESHLLAVEEKHLKQSETTAQEQQKNLDRQIKEIRTRLSAYPNTDRYQVDCFALDLQYDFGRLAVYDHGRVAK